MFACLPLRLLITSGMIWTLYDWLNKFYSFYMTAVVNIVSWHGMFYKVFFRSFPGQVTNNYVK